MNIKQKVRIEIQLTSVDIFLSKNFYDLSIGSNIKRYEEIRKSTTGQVEDYTRGCLLDYKSL